MIYMCIQWIKEEKARTRTHLKEMNGIAFQGVEEEEEAWTDWKDEGRVWDEEDLARASRPAGPLAGRPASRLAAWLG